MLNSSGNPLRVALLSISPHNRAILEFFFAGAGKQLFKTSSLPEAEILIADFDHPGAEQEWQQETSTSNKPGIVLSVREVKINNTVWVPKPLTSQALVNAAEKMRALLPEQAPVGTSQNLEKPFPSLPPKLTTRPFGLNTRPAARPVPTTRPLPAHQTFRLPEEDDADVGIATLAKKETAPRTVTVAAPLAQSLGTPSIPATDGFLTIAEIHTPEKNQAEAEQRWLLLCGNYEDIDPATWHDSVLRYTTENYLLNSVLDALQLARQSGQTVQVKIDGQDDLLLMPATNLAHSRLDIHSATFAELCNTPIQAGRVQLHLPSMSELAAIEQTHLNDTENTHDLEALIWTTSLLTSHGRLNRNIDARQNMILKHWPNLTRLEALPHVMRIAAIWQERPGSVFDVAKWLNIPQRYVFAFFTAASTLGLLVVDQGKIHYQENAAPKKNRGLFSRLLKRLLGGGAK